MSQFAVFRQIVERKCLLPDGLDSGTATSSHHVFFQWQSLIVRTELEIKGRGLNLRRLLPSLLFLSMSKCEP